MANITKTDRDAYIDAYEKYAAIYGDPVKIMFEIASAVGEVEPGVRRAATSDLMAYRFPKTKAIDIQATMDATAGFSFMMVPHKQASILIEGEVLQPLNGESQEVIQPQITQAPDDWISPQDEFAREDLLG